ncbi:carbonic anhydrase [Hypoxylon crocopeplum]|nr:carbonic anhydrase [Hypoxylon crocopeplum]
MSSNSFVLELLDKSQDYAKTHTPSPVINDVPVSARGHTIIFCCADGRIDPKALFGLSLADAVVVRNAGCGMPRMINDLLILDEVLELREVLIISHTDCGLTHVEDDAIRKGVKQRVTDLDEEIDNMHFGAFKDNFARVKGDMNYFKSHPLVRRELAENTYGAVYDIITGKVTRVEI